MNGNVTWPTYSAVLTSLIALAISYFQYRATRTKFRIDLYEKRFKIYEATLAFLRAAASQDVKLDEMIAFDKARNEAFFLFGNDPKIVKYLKSLRDTADAYNTVRSQTKELSGSDDDVAIELRKKRNQIQEKILSEHNIAPLKFAPYLAFGK
ncbi:MAG TPA: hypothetical protein VMR33_14350 [Candidatus Baltobacteraceae bacterium]|nr:hypothetical protein [Candidatus Baltobacteraceae bacterium]